MASATMKRCRDKAPNLNRRSHRMKNSAERSIITYSNEHEKVVKIDSKIYSQGEGSDSPGGFRFKRTGKIN